MKYIIICIHVNVALPRDDQLPYSVVFSHIFMYMHKIQDKDGDTALHCAIHGRRYQSMCALLDAGADPSLVNFNIYTPLHLAVKVGFLP